MGVQGASYILNDLLRFSNKFSRDWYFLLFTLKDLQKSLPKSLHNA